MNGSAPITVAGACPACGESVLLRVRLVMERKRVAGKSQTRVAMHPMTPAAHYCADKSTYPLFD